MNHRYLQTGPFRIATWRACLLVLLAGPTTSLRAQLPDTTFLSADRADALAGLYTLDDGRALYVMDIRDQLGGRPVLSVTEYASGRVRALYPTDTANFEAGDAWFRRDSIEYRVSFDETTRPAPEISWEEDGRTIRGRRAPLQERDVTVRSGDLSLAGTLVLPPGRGPHPAVVMVPGSGPLTRRTPRYMGDLLAHHGVAVLAMDKRGTGGSEGNWYGLSHADWAVDVEAALDFLHTQPDIAPSRLGLFAGSEGGFVAPVVAARRPDVSFLVCRVCSALPHPIVILDMESGRLAAGGMPDSSVALAAELLERLMRFAIDRSGYDSLVAFAASGAGQAWRGVFPPDQIPARDADYWNVYRDVLVVDPREAYGALSIPVLAILGERDERVLVNKHRAALDSLARSGRDITVWVIPQATHGLLLNEPERGPVGYPPGMHDGIAQWVARHAGVGTP